MTAWTPTPTLTVNGAAYTGFVDWSMTIGTQQNQLWALPLPSTATLQLHFTNDAAVNPLQLGDIVQIKINYSTGSSAFYTGKVSDSTVAYGAYGAAGYDLVNTVQLLGALNSLVNATASYTFGLTLEGGFPANLSYNVSQMIDFVMDDLSSTMWQEVNPAYTWNDLDAAWTWNTFDAATSSLINGYQTNLGAGDGISTTYATFFANVSVWEQIQMYVTQTNGTCWEDATGKIIFNLWPSTPTPTQIPVGVVDPSSLQSARVLDGIRNIVNIYNAIDPPTLTYSSSESTSVIDYGPQTATMLHYWGYVTARSSTMVARFIDGLSFPKNGITGFRVDLLNDALTDAQRDALLNCRPMTAYELTSLAAWFGYSGKVVVTGYQWEINRQTFALNAITQPFTNFYPGDTWLQVSPAYTWTSYGTAFPTQKWSDL
jgi:hypothetical protein